MEVYDIEKIQSFKRLGLTLECVTAYDDTILICIKGGMLLEYRTKRVSDGTRSKQRVLFESKTHKDFSRKPVTEIHAVPECGLLISLSDSILHIYDLHSLEFKMSLAKSKGTSLFALDVKKTQDKKSKLQTRVTMKICAAIGRKLQLWKWKDKQMIEIQCDLSLCKAPRAMVLTKNILFVGFKDEYFMIRLDTEEVQDLFNLGSSQKEPILSKLDHETVLVGYEYKSVVFDNSVGVPRKDYYFMWSNIPSFIVYDPPYVIAVLQKHIEVRSFKPPAMLQTLELKNVRSICKGSDFLCVESNHSVTLLIPRCVHERLSRHMSLDQFEVALQLTKRSDGSEEERLALEEKIKCRHAVHLFCQHKYQESMEIFLRLDVDPTHVIGLYPHLLPTKLKSSLMFPEDLPRLEGVDFEKSLIALVEYLSDKRRLIDQEEELKPLTPIMDYPVESGRNLTLKTKDQVFSVIDTTLLKCYLNTNEAMIAPLLRSTKHKVHVKEAEKMLLKKQKLSELIILYQQHKMHTEALELMKDQGSRSSRSSLSGPDMTVQYLQGLGKDYLPLIFKYSEWILKSYPTEGLKIFTDDDPVVESLPRGHVLSFIENVSKDIAISYLEHVIYEWKDTSEELHYSLALLLRDEVRKLSVKPQTDGTLSPTSPKGGAKLYQFEKYRTKLLHFLQTSQYYKAADVLMSFTSLDGFYEERAILFGRLHRHEQSLGIYVIILHDHNAAEQHCRRYYCKDNKEDRDVFLILLKIYLQPPAPELLGLSEYQHEPKPNFRAALTLLEDYPTSIDLVKALEILPQNLRVRKLLSFLEASVHSLMAQRNTNLMKKKMQYTTFLKISEERILFDNTHFVISEDQNCPECHRKLGNSFYARYPCGTVVHYGCCKDPKTQLERTSSLSSLSKSLTDQDLEFSLSESLTDDDLENSNRSGFRDWSW